MKVDWSNWDCFLGTMTDVALAKKIGCASGTVVRRRQKLHISPFLEKLAWSQSDALLFDVEGKIKCRKCSVTLPANLFIKNKFAKHGYRKECSECHQKLIKDRRRRIKNLWIKEMGGCCQNCGFEKWIGSLQFHHIKWEWRNKDENKIDPNVVMYRKYNEKQIRLELDKCCLLCSNCHSAIHSHEIEPKFSKRVLGWTIQSLGDALDSRICPIEDMGFTNSSVKEKDEDV